MGFVDKWLTVVMIIVLGDEELYGEFTGGIRPRWGSTVHHSVLLLSDVLSVLGWASWISDAYDQFLLRNAPKPLWQDLCLRTNIC